MFDNLVLLKELPGYALLEPIPLRPTPRPPVDPGQGRPGAARTPTVYMADIYAGDGLKGVPRGTVKSLRLFTYHFAYQGMGGLLGVIGMDGPWDIKRVLGTVPVDADGSAQFRVPANTPISLQPLDAEGKALQLMRSWMTAMPGETRPCVGCHERQNTAPPNEPTLALNAPPAEIEPWYGPAARLQLSRARCSRCSTATASAATTASRGPTARRCPDLRGDREDHRLEFRHRRATAAAARGKFSVGYAELHRFVRRPGIESDYHLLEPMEFHADTTQLVQMLKQGPPRRAAGRRGLGPADHLDRPELPVPRHVGRGAGQARACSAQRRRELLKLLRRTSTTIRRPCRSTAELPPVEPIVPPSRCRGRRPTPVDCPGWPFDAAEAAAPPGGGRRRGRARTIDLGDGVDDRAGADPGRRVRHGQLRRATPTSGRLPRCASSGRSGWRRCEVTNEQFARFDPDHDSRVEDEERLPVRHPRLSRSTGPSSRSCASPGTRRWHFCRWLSREDRRAVHAADRGAVGIGLPRRHGDAVLLTATWTPTSRRSPTWPTPSCASSPATRTPSTQPLANPTKYDDWIPKDTRFNDGALLTVAPGRYQPNAWGLFDMHGNVAEWTRTTYRPYPYCAGDGRDAAGGEGRKVVRGGSWRDEPKRATSSFRLSYPPYQRVYNVGFRVVCETGVALAQRQE